MKWLFNKIYHWFLMLRIGWMLSRARGYENDMKIMVKYENWDPNHHLMKEWRGLVAYYRQEAAKLRKEMSNVD